MSHGVKEGAARKGKKGTTSGSSKTLTGNKTRPDGEKVFNKRKRGKKRARAIKEWNVRKSIFDSKKTRGKKKRRKGTET